MSGRDKMLYLNQQGLDQNNKIKDITRTANATLDVQYNTLRALDDQGQKIQHNIDLNDQIRENVQMVGKKTQEMRRRNICIKLSLYISILALFALIVVSIIVKVKK